MDAYEQLRNLSLREVLAGLGVQSSWRERKNGTEWGGACPFHAPKRNTTSFSFDATGRYHCFSCGQKGKGAIDLVMAYQKVSFKEAVAWLSSISTSNPEQTTETTAPIVASQENVLENKAYKASYEKYYVPSEWLTLRGLKPETLQRYGVGEYNNPARKSLYTGKVMLPIRRFSDGVCVGYLVRSIQGEPKYLFPKGVAKHLEVFGSWELRQTAPYRIAYLVESPFCVLKFAQLGLPAVSCYGWSVSEQQAQILAALAKGWVYLPDSNVRTSIHPSLAMVATRCWVKCPDYPATDPEHLTVQQLKSL